MAIDIKTFFNVFFILVTFFTFFNVFLFSKRFYKVGKVQSGKQINKKHFQNNSNEIDLRFFCRMSNDLKCLPINFFHCWPKTTTVSAKLN